MKSKKNTYVPVSSYGRTALRSYRVVENHLELDYKIKLPVKGKIYLSKRHIKAIASTTSKINHYIVHIPRNELFLLLDYILMDPETYSPSNKKNFILITKILLNNKVCEFSSIISGNLNMFFERANQVKHAQKGK